ncbi:MAG: hypothetical protein E7313_03320 [Clostridiales bacterium]|nr:hypothetical protein [Clostridiales bacterium]
MKSESPEMQRYLKKYAVKTLNSCKAFVKVYGRDFAAKRLEQNLKAVYVEGYNIFYGALYQSQEQSIILCSDDPNKETLTVDDVKQDRNLRQKAVHEAVHAIFEKTEKECESLGILYGCGIEEGYENNEEIGRGLNEGITEWICEKAGVGQRCYNHAYKIVKLLELAIGEENVMRLANGNINENATQTLGMSKEQYKQILSIIDRIYRDSEKTYAMSRIVDALKKIETETIGEEEKEKLKQELGEYYQFYEDGVGKYVKDKESQTLVKSQIIEFSIIKEDEEISLNRNLVYAEQIIFDKYFKKEIERTQNEKHISIKNMRRLSELQNLIQGVDTMGLSYLPQRFKTEIYNELINKYRTTIWGRLTGYKFIPDDRTNLSTIPKKRLHDIKEKIAHIFIGKNQQEIPVQEESEKPEKNFRKKVSDMENYAKEQPNSCACTNTFEPRTENIGPEL